MSAASTTTNHDTIREWVEQRGGHPATVSDTEQGNSAGLLRIDFGEADESLNRINWEEFFDKFDEEKLQFLYQEETDEGDTSRFCKFVSG